MLAHKSVVFINVRQSTNTAFYMVVDNINCAPQLLRNWQLI